MTPADPRPLAAAGSIVAAMALIGLIDNVVLWLAKTGGLFQFHLLRALIALPVIVLVARLSGRRLQPLKWRAVLVRSLLVSISMMFYFGALAFLPVAQVAAGLFTAPIFVLLISALVFGERVGWVNILAVAVGFGGVLSVLRPDPGALSPVLLAPLAAGFFYAMGAIATRRYCGSEGTLTLLAVFFCVMAVWGVVGSSVLTLWAPEVLPGPEGFVLRAWGPLTAEFLGLVVVQAVGAVLGVGLIIRGYLLAEASFVSVFEYVLLIFAGFWGYLLWGDVLDGVQIAGVVLIIVSGAVLARARGMG